MGLTLAKSKKIYGKIVVSAVFQKGDSCIAYPLRASFCINTNVNSEPVEILVSAPKRLFKRAVKRNRIKRLMRESYRLNQQVMVDFCIKNNLALQIAISYIGEEEKSFADTQKAMLKLMNKIKDKTQTPSI